MILTFSDYIAPTTTASGKLAPAKAKASGKTYTLSRAVVELVENSLGTPLECEVTTDTRSVNGKVYTNFGIKSAKHIVVPSAGPESPPSNPTANPTIPNVQEGPVPTSPAPAWQKIASHMDPHAGSGWQNTDAARQRLIVRQSSLARAVEVLGPGKTLADYEELTDLFTALVMEEKSRGLNGGGGDKPGDGIPAARSQAQEHLETARQKLADIRAGYSDEDAVCPACGRREFLKQWDGGWFCSKKDGGCGHPPKGERLDFPSTYGEWRQRTASNLRRPDAPVVSPVSHPSR